MAKTAVSLYSLSLDQIEAAILAGGSKRWSARRPACR